jgi:hypothetical protein
MFLLQHRKFLKFSGRFRTVSAFGQMGETMPEGIIIAYSKDMTAGVIKSGKKNYYFNIKEWLSETPPANNLKVSFEMEKSNVRNVKILK